MEDREKLNIIKRELLAIGSYYRNDWSDFDGRTLRNELYDLMCAIERQEDFTEFTDMLKEQQEEYQY